MLNPTKRNNPVCASNRGYLFCLAFVMVVVTGCSSPAEKANGYFEKGMALMKSGDLVKANIELQNALQIKQDLVPAWYALSQIAEQQADWKRMFGLLNKVVDHDPKHLEAQIKLSRLLLASGNIDKALAASDITLAIDKDHPMVLAQRAAVLYKLNDKQAALTFANAALKKDPQNVDALVVLATERLAAKDAIKAIEYLDLGLRANERNVALQLIKVQAFESLAKLDSAEQVFRRLIALYPDNRNLRYILAQFFLSHGNKVAAEAEYRAVMKANPTDLQARLDVVRFVQGIRGAEAAKQELQAQIASDPSNSELKFALASMHIAEKNITQAEGIYKALIDKAGASSPEGVKAKGLLAVLKIAEGDKATARTLIEQVLASDQRNEQGLLLKARMAIDDRQLDQAIVDLRAILKDTPNSPRALLMLAEAHEQGASYELAQESYLKAFQASKQSPQFGLPYGAYLLRRNQAARAEDVAMDMRRTQDKNLDVLKLLAQARIAKGDWVGAQAVSDEIAKLGNAGSTVDQIRGAVMAARKNYDESIAAFKRVHAAAPSEAQPLVALIRTYVEANKTGEAIAFLHSVLKASPDNVDALVMLGQLQAMKGEFAAANATFNLLIEKHPTNTAGYIGLVGLLTRERKFDEADAQLKKGLVAIPKDLSLRMTRASVLEISGKTQDAILAYEELIKEQPNSDVIANNLASLLTDHRSDKGSLDRAKDLAQRFKRSDVPQFKDTLGWAYLKSGNAEEALPLIESAVKQVPEYPVFHYHLGATYLALNKKDLAKKSLEKALALGDGKGFGEVDQAKQLLQTINK